jgi:hypothetical protein
MLFYPQLSQQFIGRSHDAFLPSTVSHSLFSMTIFLTLWQFDFKLNLMEQDLTLYHTRKSQKVP